MLNLMLAASLTTLPLLLGGASTVVDPHTGGRVMAQEQAPTTGVPLYDKPAAGARVTGTLRPGVVAEAKPPAQTPAGYREVLLPDGSHGFVVSASLRDALATCSTSPLCQDIVQRRVTTGLSAQWDSTKPADTLKVFPTPYGGRPGAPLMGKPLKHSTVVKLTGQVAGGFAQADGAVRGWVELSKLTDGAYALPAKASPKLSGDLRRCVLKTSPTLSAVPPTPAARPAAQGGFTGGLAVCETTPAPGTPAGERWVKVAQGEGVAWALAAPLASGGTVSFEDPDIRRAQGRATSPGKSTPKPSSSASTPATSPTPAPSFTTTPPSPEPEGITPAAVPPAVEEGVAWAPLLGGVGALLLLGAGYLLYSSRRRSA